MNVAEGAEWIAGRASCVKINNTMLGVVMDKLSKQIRHDINWKEHPLNPKTPSESTVNWYTHGSHGKIDAIQNLHRIFLCDLLNFSFWTDEGKEPFQVEYEGKLYSGYWSLCACLNRAIQNNIPILDFAAIATMPTEHLRAIFNPTTGSEMPMLERRLELLLEATTLISQKYGNSFVNVIRQANNSAQTLMNLIIADFPSFNDTAVYQGKVVSFAKRAQILVADLWACFEGDSFDYRIPQVLCHLGVLEYSQSLLQRLKKGELLLNKSEEECEIRGCSIHACQLMKGHLPGLTAIHLDFYLWDLVNQNRQDFEKTPFHRVRSIYY